MKEGPLKKAGLTIVTPEEEHLSAAETKTLDSSNVGELTLVRHMTPVTPAYKYP
jgi:hypothetical protein